MVTQLIVNIKSLIQSLSILVRENALLVFGMLFLGILIPLMPGALIGTSIWDNYKFILLALFPVLCFSYILFGKKEIIIPIIALDIAWLIFLGVGFLSFFWAINGSLVWNAAFGYLSLILWMLLFRALSLQKSTETYLSILLLTLFLGLFLHFVLALSTGLLKEPIYWNIFFGYDSNRNFTASYFLSLYPFLLFYPFKNTTIIKVLHFVCASFVIYVLVKGDARGAVIAFLFIALFYAKILVPKKYFQNLILVSSVVFICISGFLYYNSNLLGNIPVFKEFTLLDEGNRLYMVSASIWLFLENPIAGIGLGNWHIEAYKYNLDRNVTFAHPLLIVYYRNHNLFSQYLAELGSIGFLSFLSPIAIVLWKGWTKCKNLTPFQKGAYASLLVYLVTACFYHTTSFSEYRFSGMHLLAFCFLGILTTDNNRLYLLPKYTNFLFLSLSLCCLSWFVYNNQSFNKYLLAASLSESQPVEAIQEFEALYHPDFKTIHDYKTSIPFQLAKLYESQKMYDKAEEYFQESLQKSPYDREILLTYANFLLKIRKEPAKAKIYAERFYSIHSGFSELELVLAEIAINEKHYEKASTYLDSVYKIYNKKERKRLRDKIKQETQ